MAVIISSEGNYMKKVLLSLLMMSFLSGCGPTTQKECEDNCFECDESGCATTLDCLCQCDAKCKNGA